MGLLNKIKNMFTEEVEVEVEQPIKKEVIQVEIPAPVKQEKKEIIFKEKKEEEKIVVTDSPALKQDEKNKFPIFFDDDFEVLEKKEKVVKQEKKENPKIIEKPVLPPYGIKTQQQKEEAKKVFKPTPIISPVYGILDKDYRKEDLTIKKVSDDKNTNKTTYKRENKELTIDDIRNKAYGTLEDEIEKNMDDSSYYLEEKKAEADMFDNFFEEEIDDDVSIDELLNKELYKTEEDVNDNNNKEENNTDKKKTRTERIYENNDEELTKNIDENANINDSDLLNMIDSMYQKGDEE